MKMLVGGKWVDLVSADVFSVNNPAALSANHVTRLMLNGDEAGTVLPRFCEAGEAEKTWE